MNIDTPMQALSASITVSRTYDHPILGRVDVRGVVSAPKHGTGHVAASALVSQRPHLETPELVDRLYKKFQAEALLFKAEVTANLFK
jgi:hypothetical protein